MLKTYKFRLYPNKEEIKQLEWTLEQCRFVYNTMLSWLQKQDKPDKYKLQNALPLLKEQFSELKNVYSKALQYEVYRLFSNLKSLSQSKKTGRKIGKLRFKGKGNFKTIHYNQSGFKIIPTEARLDTLHISKIGDIPMRIHRKIDGHIKQVVIKKYPSGKWFACIVVEQDMIVQRQPVKKLIAMDMGLEEFLTDTAGRRIENPRYLKKSLKQLRHNQRRLSKKEKKSKNRSKQIVRVARLHERIKNQRDDFEHKLARYYVNKYDFIAIEDLNIKAMFKSMEQDVLLSKKQKRNMQGAINDVAWYRFARILSYKAEWAGKTFIKVNPGYTSQTYKYDKSLDRDYNASLNILERSLKEIGQGLPEFTPVEIVPPPEMKNVLASTVVESGNLFQKH